MKSRKNLLTLLVVLTTLSVFHAVAQVETPLYSFKGGKDGDSPVTGVLFHNHDLFGTTFHGGSAGLGTVYRLTPPASGSGAWTKKTLHSFLGNGEDGGPSFSSLVKDKAGNLYGTTLDNEGCCGVVFKLTPPAAGESGWSETVLHAFTGDPDCDTPTDFPAGLQNALTLVSGTLYGATSLGGAFGLGCIFKLTPPASGQTEWTETVLYSFAGGTDGSHPNGGLLFDKSSGALLGTTYDGGLYGLGTAFILYPPAAGATGWTKATIHHFQGDATDAHDGSYPNGNLVGGIGLVYGTTQLGGAAIPCCGVVFELLQQSVDSDYTFYNLHSFTGGQDGAEPYAGLYKDASGVMWGTTYEGGAGTNGGADFGTVFKLAPKLVGIPPHWELVYSVVYSFNGGTVDGAYPESPVTEDSAGNLYGTTVSGGMWGKGTVYELVP